MCNCEENNEKIENTKETNWQRIREAEQKRIEIINEELNWFDQEELDNTANRVTKFYKEWAGNGDFNFTNFKVDAKGGNSFVILKDINYHSMCAHHLLPFYGKAHIAYLPKNGVVCGVSKLARTVIKYASRPQLQERLTDEVADHLFDELNASFVLVIIEGEHLCMKMRGVKQHTSSMTTSSLRWDKHDKVINTNFQTIKSEALNLIHKG